MGRTKQKPGEPTIIKKYANRRLYDTGRSSYVTLDDLSEMVRDGYDFVVVDAKTGEDLTRSVLTQIIVEQEGKGEEHLLPTSFLRQLISFYGDNLQTTLPDYLEQTMQFFTKNQADFQKQMEDAMGTGFGGVKMSDPMSTMEEISRKNMEMFENAMRAWSPFMGGTTSSQAAEKTSESDEDAQKVQELQDTINRMQEELNRLSGK